jgi:citron Rho-interacting kinase
VQWYLVFEIKIFFFCFAGSENGLFSFKRHPSFIVKIKGIEGITMFGIQRNCLKAILISNHDKTLYQCDLHQLENCSSISPYNEPIVDFIRLDFSFIQNNEQWHYCDVNFDGENISAIAAQASRILILKFDTSSNIFKPVRTMDTAKPVVSAHFTMHSIIVASNKFFEIDLMTYGAEEFLDMSDTSSRDTVNLQPLFITKINSEEFLLCFKDIGIFVDEFGNRSRPILENLEWLNEPKDFAYNNTILFVSYAQSLQVFEIKKSLTKKLIQQNQTKSLIKKNCKRTASLHLPEHKILCVDSQQQGIYISTRKIDEKNNINYEIYFINGINVLIQASKIYNN